MILTTLILALSMVGLTVVSYQVFMRLRSLGDLNQSLLSKYGAIIDFDAHMAAAEQEKLRVEYELSAIQSKYKDKREIFDNLVKEVAIYNEDIAIAEWGIYKPHFDFDVSEKFKIAIKENQLKQKDHLKEEMEKLKAIVGRDHGWLDMYKLSNYAFNQACESALENVRWNNCCENGRADSKSI